MTDLIRIAVNAAPIRVTVSENEAVEVDVLSMPVSVRVVGQPGPEGPPGPTGGEAAGWTYYALRWSSPPVAAGPAAVSGVAGSVMAYTLDGVTRYRFAPDAYDPALDAFYAAFSGGTLSNLLVARSD